MHICFRFSHSSALYLKCCKYSYSSAFHCYAIYDYDLISEWPVWLQVFLYLSFSWWLAMEDEIWQNAYMLIIYFSYSYFFCPHTVWYAHAWCFAMMVIHILGIFTSLFVSCLCLVSQPLMNSCSPGFYKIRMLYLCIFIVFFEACVIDLLHLSWILLPVAWDL